MYSHTRQYCLQILAINVHLVDCIKGVCILSLEPMTREHKDQDDNKSLVPFLGKVIQNIYDILRLYT